MANKVQAEDIVKMNELYLIHKTYAAVARLVGFSPFTVKKYIKENFVAQEDLNIIPFNGEIKPMKEIIKTFTNWNDFLCLSEEEQIECMGLRKEILL